MKICREIFEIIPGRISRAIPGDIFAGTTGEIPKGNLLDVSKVKPDEIYQGILEGILGRI